MCIPDRRSVEKQQAEGLKLSFLFQRDSEVPSAPQAFRLVSVARRGVLRCRVIEQGEFQLERHSRKVERRPDL